MAWASISADSSIDGCTNRVSRPEYRRLVGRICGLVTSVDLGLDEADYTRVCYSPQFHTQWKPWLDSASFCKITPQFKNYHQKLPSQSSLTSVSSTKPLYLSLEIGHCFYKSPLQVLKKKLFPRTDVPHLGSQEAELSAPLESDCFVELDDVKHPVFLAFGCAYWMKLSVTDGQSSKKITWEGIIYSDSNDIGGPNYEVRIKCQEQSATVLNFAIVSHDHEKKEKNPKTLIPQLWGSNSQSMRLTSMRIETTNMSEAVRGSDTTQVSPDLVQPSSTAAGPGAQDNYRFNVLLKQSVPPLELKYPSEGPGNIRFSTLRKHFEPLRSDDNASFLTDSRPQKGFDRVEAEKPSENRFSALLSVVGNSRRLFTQATQRESCFTLQNQAETLHQVRHRELTNALLETALPNFRTLACSIYGNFFIQILLRKADGQTISSIVERVPNLINTLSSDKVGVFTIQKIIAKLETKEQHQSFLAKLQQSSLVKLSMEALPTFMFKKVLSTFPGHETASLLLQSLRPSFLTVASDKHGICVIKLILSTLEDSLGGYLSVLQEFLQHLEQGKHNSHFNFGIHHLLETAYSRGYLVAGVERLVQAYLSPTEGRLRLRSRAVLQTLLMLLEYPIPEFRRNAVLPALRKAFPRPATPQELVLLEETAVSHRETADRIKLILSCFETFAEY